MISSLEPFSRQSRERTAAGRSSYGSARSRVAGGLLILAGKRAADHQALDVVGALVDLGDPHGAENALDAVIRDVAGAAQRLDRIRADALGGLAGKQFRHRGLFEARQPLAAQREIGRASCREKG